MRTAEGSTWAHINNFKSVIYVGPSYLSLIAIVIKCDSDITLLIEEKGEQST